MEELIKYTNKLKSHYSDLTEDIDKVLQEVEIDIENGVDENVAIQQAFRMIDELL